MKRWVRFSSRLPESVIDAYGIGRVRSQAADADRRWLLASGHDENQEAASRRRRNPRISEPTNRRCVNDKKGIEFSEVVQGK